MSVLGRFSWAARTAVARPLVASVRHYVDGVGADVHIKELLSKRSGSMITVSPGDTASAAARVMNEANVGSAIVMDDGKVYGIVTERDFLKKIVVQNQDPTKVEVKDIATRDVVAADESATVGQCMSMMNQKGMRHLPIVRGSEVIDVISIRDLIMAVHESQESELTYLRDFVGAQGHMYSGTASN